MPGDINIATLIERTPSRPSRKRKTDSTAKQKPAFGFETDGLPVVECIFESQRRVEIPHPFTEGVPKTSVYNVRLKISGPLNVASTSELRAGLWRVTPTFSRQSDSSWRYETLAISNDEIVVRKVKFKDCSYTLQHCCFVIAVYSIITRRLLCCSGKFKVLARKRKRESPKPRIRHRHFKTTVVADYMRINTALYVESVTSPGIANSKVGIRDPFAASQQETGRVSYNTTPVSQTQSLDTTAQAHTHKVQTSSVPIPPLSLKSSAQTSADVSYLSMNSLAARKGSDLKPSNNSAFKRTVASVETSPSE